MKLAVLLALLFMLQLTLTAQPPASFGFEEGQASPLSALDPTMASRSGTYPQNELLWSYDVKYYGSDVHVDPNLNTIRGRVNLVATVPEVLIETFVLELLDNMQVDSVKMNAQALPFTHEG